MFVGKPKAYPSEATHKCSTLVKSLALLVNIRLVWKNLPLTNYLIRIVIKYGCEKFYNIGPRGLYHKTFYDRILCKDTSLLHNKFSKHSPASCIFPLPVPVVGFEPSTFGL
jgi:hypothetical protein